MEKTIKTYRPSELASMFLLHPNTIRFYESTGFISRASRGANGYRHYTEKHVLQLKIVRAVFAYPYTNQQIRRKGNNLVKKVAEEDLILGKEYANRYIVCINKEIEKAESTLKVLIDWAEQKQEEAVSVTSLYTRKEIASLLGTTSEAIRNWERNDLIKTQRRGKNNEVLFEDKNFKRLKIIYMLRQTGYSMSAIHRCLVQYDKGETEKLSLALNRLEQEELLSAGDAWNNQLKKVREGAEKIPLLIEQISQLENRL